MTSNSDVQSNKSEEWMNGITEEEILGQKLIESSDQDEN